MAGHGCSLSRSWQFRCAKFHSGFAHKAHRIQTVNRRKPCVSAGHKSYRLLVSGFFVCGFQVALHHCAFSRAILRDNRIDSSFCRAVAGGSSAFFNIIARWPRLYASAIPSPMFTGWIYIGRSIARSRASCLCRRPATSVVIFRYPSWACLWLSNVPPTMRWWRSMFGTRHLGMLRRRGVSLHQIGSFLASGLALSLRYLRHLHIRFWWLLVCAWLVRSDCPLADQGATLWNGPCV